MSFSMDIAIGENGVTGVYDIETVEDRWYDPNAEYFKVGSHSLALHSIPLQVNVG